MIVPGTESPAITLTTTLSSLDQMGEELIWEEDPFVVWEAPSPEPAASPGTFRTGRACWQCGIALAAAESAGTYGSR